MTKQKITLKDIAEAAGLDVSTVSLCLNDSMKVAETTKLRVKGLAEKMDYSPNLIAKALKSGKSNTVGICFYTLESVFFNKILTSMQYSFYQHEFFPLVSALKTSDPKWVLNNLLQRNIDGLCLANPSKYFDRYLDFINTGKPISVYIEKDSLSLMEGMKANYTICDLSEGTHKIFDYLFSLNHKRIAFAGHIPNRLYDYCNILNENNIEFDDKLVINGWESLEELENKITKILKIPNPPTAIFANTDNMAISIMEILLQKGYRIPEDISLISINDLPTSKMLKIPLTTLRIPVGEIGASMAEMLLDQINNPDIGPQKRSLETELIIRDSVAAI